MTRWRKYTLSFVAVALAGALAALAISTRARAIDLITNPRATRKVPSQTPAAFGLPYENATVTTSDGLRLVGWQVPSRNGAAVMLVHGYKDDRSWMLGTAAMLHEHGYGALLLALRAHDLSDGERITFGYNEVRDLAAWYQYESTRPDVRADAIGIFGVSMGGSIAIQYAAANPRIAAVVTDSAFSSMTDTVDTSVRFFTGLPPFPFAPMILFWAGHEGGYSPSEIDAKKWIGAISPRPVFLMQGGADVVVSPESGARLYQAAREPKTLWFEPALGHAQFFDKRPAEFQRRVTAFFDRYLLNTRPQPQPARAAGGPG
jgi:uncharacterized protein